MPFSRMIKQVFDNSTSAIIRVAIAPELPRVSAISTNIRQGFNPATLIVAGRPGMGKTSFALKMAVAAARKEGAPVAFFSLEMTNAN